MTRLPLRLAALALLALSAILPFALALTQPPAAAKKDVRPFPAAEEREEEFDYVIAGETKKGKRRLLTVDIGGGEKVEFVRIEKGSFQMGAPEGEKDAFKSEKPRRRVEITKDFYLGKYEVTQGQYKALTGETSSRFKGDRLPVEQVSWVEAVKYCELVSKKVGKTVELPTEAQWEYACRAGTTTPFHFGSKLNGDMANCDGRSPYGTETKGANKAKTTKVGSYPANPWGLHDMHGNVWEWCADWKTAYVLEAVMDPQGPSSGSSRVHRGGGWNALAGRCRSASRRGYEPSNRGNGLGFRLALVPSGR